MVNFLMALIACLLALFAWREYVHDKERRDLYNRIMARDLTDYTASQKRTVTGSRNFIKAQLDREAGET